MAAVAIEDPTVISNEPPSLSSYLLRFRKLCQHEDSLKRDVLESRVHLSLEGFRSILWARWLDVLSPSINDWVTDISKSRSRYIQLRAMHEDDRRGDASLHPSINNPLSQEEDSPWNQYFKNSELRKDIERDVIRSSFEEVKSQKQVKSWMSSILFIYGKEHSQLLYRQGMHELLSCVLILWLDDVYICQKIVQGAAKSSVLELVQTLLNPDYVEHDVYALFEKIMDFMWDWYFTNAASSEIENDPQLDNETPFVDHINDLEKQHSVSNAARRLHNMWVNILQLHDKELFDHLVSQNVLPTTFGVNWTKLLFTRQFSDYFHLWDAVIVSKFSLVDYIVVAMVLSLRRMLLKGDSNACNTILVAKYPTNVCPRYIVKMALFLQDSKSFKRPMGNPFISDVSDGVDLAQYDDFEIVHLEEKDQIQRDQRSNHGTELKENVQWHVVQIQSALSQVNKAIESSRCNHAIVHDSLSQVHKAVKALADDIQRGGPAASIDNSRHKRNASIAYEALAFQ